VFYGEYKCTGEGANRSGRVPYTVNLSDEQVKPYLNTAYVDGENWLKPFADSLVTPWSTRPAHGQGIIACTKKKKVVEPIVLFSIWLPVDFIFCKCKNIKYKQNGAFQILLVLYSVLHLNDYAEAYLILFYAIFWTT
jgi:hypothetical protein